MPASAHLLLRTAVVVLLASATSLARAASDDSYVSAMRYVSLDASGDNADSRQYSGTGSFTLGKYVWLQGSVGKLTDNSSDGAGDLSNFGFGGGMRGEHLQLSINFNRYKDDADYKQRDITAALDWIGDKYSLGLDVFHRSSDDIYNADITDIFPNTGTATISTRTEQSLTGKGFGAHGNINLTDRLSLSLGAMSYSYDSDLTISADVSDAQFRRSAEILERRINTALQKRLTSRSTSSVSRNVTPLESTFNIGLSYLFDPVSISAQYVHDNLLDSDSTLDTFSLGASIFVSDHWMLSPSIGQSKSDTADSVTFGGLSVSYNW